MEFTNIGELDRTVTDFEEKLGLTQKQLNFLRIFLLTFYSIYFVAMGIWNNKAVSHTNMIKSLILLSKVALERANFDINAHRNIAEQIVVVSI